MNAVQFDQEREANHLPLLFSLNSDVGDPSSWATVIGARGASKFNHTEVRAMSQKKLSVLQYAPAKLKTLPLREQPAYRVSRQCRRLQPDRTPGCRDRRSTADRGGGRTPCSVRRGHSSASTRHMCPSLPRRRASASRRRCASRPPWPWGSSSMSRPANGRWSIRPPMPPPSSNTR